MAFIITDLADESKSLVVNFWNWHPTVELVRTLAVVDSERIELMHQQCVGTTVTEVEARRIANGLQSGVLGRLHAGERVLLDLSIASEPDDGTLYHGSESHKNYGASFEWLTRFAQFCCECHGFSVL